MLHELSAQIVDRISAYSDHDYGSDDKEKMVYTLEVFLGDTSKALILLGVFLVLGYSAFFVVAFVVTIFLRTNMGGFDFDGYGKCLLFSLAYYLGLMFVFVASPDIGVLFIPIVLSCVAIQWLIAPVVNKQRRRVRHLKRSMLRNRSVFVTSLIVLLHIIINNPYTLLGLWIVVIQTLFILMLKGVELHEKDT